MPSVDGRWAPGGAGKWADDPGGNNGLWVGRYFKSEEFYALATSSFIPPLSINTPTTSIWFVEDSNGVEWFPSIDDMSRVSFGSGAVDPFHISPEVVVVGPNGTYGKLNIDLLGIVSLTYPYTPVGEFTQAAVEAIDGRVYAAWMNGSGELYWSQSGRPVQAVDSVVSYSVKVKKQTVGTGEGGRFQFSIRSIRSLVAAKKFIPHRYQSFVDQRAERFSVRIKHGGSPFSLTRASLILAPTRAGAEGRDDS